LLYVLCLLCIFCLFFFFFKAKTGLEVLGP
jgi:hypothetical protein